MLKINFSRFVFGLLLFVGSLSISFAQTITGRITDENGEPLAGASVGIEGSAKGALTGLDGTFEIKNIPAGDYTINTTFVGYKSSSQTVTVTGVGISGVDFTLAEDLMGLDQVVVTGSFNPQSRLESTVSVTTLDRKMIDQQVPRSTGDLIDAIPGFYVESSLGEAANNVYPRGLPVGTGGLRYTSLREDGLNTFEIPDKVFFNSDGYTKIDLTVDRVEGLRGGNAVVFASNTPGGIINFISKTGGPDLSGQVRATLGSQGLYRIDMNVGGALTEDKKWRFNVGGFYRYDKGLKNFSGPINVGGQIKANVTRLFDNDKGFIRFFVKSLQDNVTLFSPVPYQNNGNPTAIPGGPDLLYGTLIPSGQYGISIQDPQFPGQFRTRDLNTSAKVNYQSVGAELQLNLGNGWTLSNKLRYVNGTQSTNLIQYLANPVLGQSYVNTLAAAGYGQGVYTYSNPNTVNGQNYSPGGIRGENIPISALSGTANRPDGGILRDGINDNGLLMNLGFFVVDSYNTNLINNLQISKQLGGHSLTGGAYFSQYNSKEYWSFNVLLTDVKDNPRLIDVNYTGLSPLAPFGPSASLTTNGLLSSNFQYEYSNTTNFTVAGFIGDEWKVSDRLNISLGFRYEVNQSRGSLQNTGRRTGAPAGTFTIGSPSTIAVGGSGGLDSNTSTLYDSNADVPVNSYTYYDITYEVWGANAGINYKLNDNQAIFASASRGTRYGNSQNFLANKDQYLTSTGQPVNLQNPVEEILQGEIGYRVSNSKFGLTATVFGTQLKDSPFTLQSVNALGQQQLDVLLYDVRNLGLEFEFTYVPVRNLRFNGAITLQKPTYTKYPKITVQTINDPNSITGATSTAEEVDFSGNQVERIPNILANITGSYKIGSFEVFANARYVGERQANRRNTYTFNPFVEVGAGVSYTSGNFSVGLNGANLFNALGITEGNTRTQDNFTKEAAANPNLINSAVFILPRSFNLTFDYKF